MPDALRAAEWRWFDAASGLTPAALAGVHDRAPVVLRAGVAALGVTLLLPLFLPGVNASYLGLALAGCVLAVLVARAEPAGSRLVSFNVFVWAMVLRMLAVTVFTALGAREGGPFLGPDSTTYYQQSVLLAGRAFHVDIHPMLFFGTYDVSHYYLFAGAVRYFHADLFGLQVMNCAMTALSAALMYGIVRQFAAPAAVVLAACIALHPSLVVLSSVDLLKDPSIIFGTILIVWIVFRLTTETNPALIAVYALVGVVAGVYVHTGRFYAFAYLELAFVAGVLYMRFVGVRVFRRALAAWAVVAMFLAGEAIPARAAWPLSPLMVMSSVSFVLDTPELSKYALGFFYGLRIPGNGSGRGARGGPTLERVHLGPESGRFAFVGITVSAVANLFRRLYGPFVWILPGDWHFRTLQAGDYLLYPGMLLWYALLPFVVIGLAWVGWRILKRIERRFPIVFLWFFTVVYFAQYLAINLSYRQRDVMVPVAIVFAFLGMWVLRDVRWRRWYAGYWAALVLLAAAHLVARAVLHA